MSTLPRTEPRLIPDSCYDLTTGEEIFVEIMSEPTRVPATVPHYSAYKHTWSSQRRYITLDELDNLHTGLSFVNTASFFRSGGDATLIIEAYHWSEPDDGELTYESLTNSRLYLGEHPRDWIPNPVSGSSLFQVTCRLKDPVYFMDQHLRYETVWRRLEERLHALKMTPDALVYVPVKSTVEPPQLMLFDAKASVVHIRYVGTLR